MRCTRERESERISILRRELQTAQTRIETMIVARPEQECAGAIGSQHLLRRPPLVIVLRCLDHNDSGGVDTHSGERRRIGNMRRRDQRDPFTTFRQSP